MSRWYEPDGDRLRVANTVLSLPEHRRADPEQVRRRRLNEKLRREWLAAAEQEWRERMGRPMIADELERVLRGYPGDV